MRARHIVVSSLLLTGAATPGAVARADGAPPFTAAYAVRDAPAIDPAAPISISDDGNTVMGRTGADPVRPFTVFDLAAGTSVDVPTNVLTSGDGRRFLTGAAVLDLGGQVVRTLPPVATLTGEFDMSDDGTVVARGVSLAPSGRRTTVVSSPGATTDLELDAGLPAQYVDHGAEQAAISGLGRYVAFVRRDVSGACPVATSACRYQVMRRDLRRDITVTVSLTPLGTESTGRASHPDISDDGRYVSFLSDATDLVPGVTAPGTRLYRRDLLTGRLLVIGDDIDPSAPHVYDMSDDGNSYAFAARAGGSGDHEVRVTDLTLRLRGNPAVVQNTTSVPACTTSPHLSGDGKAVLIERCGGPVEFPPGAANATAHIVAALAARTGGLQLVAAETTTRLYDSRAGETDSVPNLAAGSVARVDVSDLGTRFGGADALPMTVTVTNPAAAGFVTVWSCDGERPPVSNVNYSRGETVANAVFSAVGSTGEVCLYTQAGADLVVDAGSWFAPTSTYGAITPRRLLDTRVDEDALTPPTRAAGSVTVLHVVDDADLPAGTSAVVLNLTVTKPAAAGFVSVYACGGPVPPSSNLNFRAGQTVANAVVTAVGTDGTVCFYTHAPTDMIVDLDGVFGERDGFEARGPLRLVDTRGGEVDNVPNQPAGAVIRLEIATTYLASELDVAVLNVTAVNATAAGFVTVWPCEGDAPTTSVLNYTAGSTTAALVVAPPGGLRRAVCLYANTDTDLVVDLLGGLSGF